VAPLLAVDGPSLLYRTFFALPRTIVGVGGWPVNALLGSVNVLLRVASEHDPRAVVVCFGREAAVYRVKLYPPYHADRPPMPKELERQFSEAPKLFDAFGWSTVTQASLEADDLLHSLAAQEEEAGGSALILTGDRDMFQCVTESVRVLYLRGGGKGADLVDTAEVERRYGVPPALVPDFIALRGDPSDSLPGASGIGAKTAAELLRRHGSLEATIAGALRERSVRVRGALREQTAQLESFKEIATLRRVAVEHLPDRPTDLAHGAEAARRLGMTRLADRLAQPS
jgi:5'-3' exonuclease